MADKDENDTRRKFEDAVNMSPAELEEWLATDESREVGWTRRGVDEAFGNWSGRRVVEIKRKPSDQLTDDDYAHMRKVVGYVMRHAGEPPREGVSSARWRFGLMNWGHDPLKRQAQRPVGPKESIMPKGGLTARDAARAGPRCERAPGRSGRRGKL